ncbi:MAG: lysine 2,3-aminomutase [Candidatus Omnitrophota bacterium]
MSLSGNRRSILWGEVAGSDWDDWKWQVKMRITGLEQIKALMNITEEEEMGIAKARGRLSMAITPYWAMLIDPDNPKCPIRRQVVPLSDEFHIDATDMLDPCGEDKDSPVTDLVHRYPDRILLLATDLCSSYCRHCTRRRMVGTKERVITNGNLEKAYEYIKSNRKIRDVLISGGDPLMLDDDKLEHILKTLRDIPHVELLRIGSRVPVTMPMRITPQLIDMLKKYAPIWMSLHFNHPKEVTKEVKAACNTLSDNGFVLGSQTVLLKGINDKPSIMKRLMHELIKIRVRPYYIYQCDPVRGTSHFRTSISTGINIMEKLRGHTSGYAIPTYVIDAPGGGGKIPIAPNYIITQSKGEFTIRNYKGEIYTYKEPQSQDAVSTKQQSINSEEKHVSKTA